jgi:hypothetical protein
MNKFHFTLNQLTFIPKPFFFLLNIHIPPASNLSIYSIILSLLISFLFLNLSKFIPSHNPFNCKHLLLTSYKYKTEKKKKNNLFIYF